MDNEVKNTKDRHKKSFKKSLPKFPKSSTQSSVQPLKNISNILNRVFENVCDMFSGQNFQHAKNTKNTTPTKDNPTQNIFYSVFSRFDTRFFADLTNSLHSHPAFLAFKEAFPHTLPIFVGYILMGATFGILLQKAGFNWVWALGMGVIIYAGAMQFACVALLANGASLLESFLLALMINSRQIFYALSALSLFRGVEKKKKWYLIFSLTDETFALLNLKKPRPSSQSANPNTLKTSPKSQANTKASPKIDSGYFMFFIALLNQTYWVIGCVSGALLSQHLTSFNAQGMAFVMNAIFIVLFIEQWRVVRDKSPALIGIFVSLICLWIFGKDIFLLPSLVLICALLFWLEKDKSLKSNKFFK